MRSFLIQQVNTLLTLSVGLLVSAGVLASAASSWLARDYSELSIQINPFNSTARLEHLTGQLNSPEADTEQLEKIAVSGLRYAPSDPRFLSVLGMIKARSGKDSEAQKLFSATLSKMPTEVQSLRRMFDHAVKGRQFKAAAHHAELIGRRWPERWRSIEANISQVLSDRAAFGILADGLGGTETGRNLLIASLLKPERLLHANRLLMYWRNNKRSGLSPLVADVTNVLIANGYAQAARVMFLNANNDEKIDPLKPLYNGDFQREFSGNPFDWNIRKQAGVSIARVLDKAADGDASKTDADKVRASKFNVRVEFRDTPVLLKNLAQQTVLSPGVYGFEMDYHTQGLKAPKPIHLSVECIDTKSPLVRLEVDPDQRSLATMRGTFRVPQSGCPTQRVFLGNDVKTQSWKNRFQGSLILSRISLVRTGN